MKHRPRDNPFKNSAYEKWIRTQDCLVRNCWNKVVNHHMYHARNNSYLSSPLCIEHHTLGTQAYHVLEHEGFEKEHGLNLDWELQKLLMKYIDELKK